MENDDRNSELIDTVFKPEHMNQNLEENNQFIQWRDLMNRRFNPDNNRMYKCFNEECFFYAEKNGNQDFKVHCPSPSCHRPICCICEKPYLAEWYGYCCISRKIREMHSRGVEYSNGEGVGFYGEEEETIFFFIPIINYLYFVSIIFNGFFFKISSNIYDRQRNEMTTYEGRYRENCKRFILILAFFGFTGIILLIPLLMLNIAISIIIALLAIIRFKWYKYLIGFFNQDFYFLDKNRHKMFSYF